MNKEFERNKIVVLTIVGTVIFFVLWLMIYVPMTRKFHDLQSDVADCNKCIEKIESVFEGNVVTSQRMEILEEKYNKLDKQFPQKEEKALKMLSDFARELNIQLTSIKSQEKMPFMDTNNQEVVLDGKRCEFVAVSMELQTSYKDLVFYVTKIKKDLPAYVTFHSVEIVKRSADVRMLSISLKFNLYLLS